MGDNSLYHVLALISKNHKYNKMKSSFIYLLFLEESHNPLRIKSLCGKFKDEVMSWQQFWFLHTYNICIDVQLIYCKGITFLWMGKKVVKISLYGCDYLNLVYHQSAILWVSRFRHSPISVARLQRKYRLHWKLKGRAASRFGLNLPPPESIHPENLSPFKPVLKTADGNGNERLTKM